MSRIVFFADSHLADRAWVGRPIEGDSYHSFQQIVDHARRIDAVAVIGAGDLIDRQINRASPIARLYGFIDQLAESRIPFYYIQGQHEMDKVPWCSAHPWATHLHQRAVTCLGYRVYGLDYQPFGQLQDELSRVPGDTDVLVAHQVWSDFMGEGPTNPQGAFADVPAARVLVTGDFHQRLLHDSLGFDGQKLRVVSPGSTCLQSIDEPADKFFVTMDDAGGLEFVPLRTRPRIAWDFLQTESDLERCLDTIGAAVAEARDGARRRHVPDGILMPIVRVVYAHHLADVPRRVAAAVGGQAHLFFKEQDTERDARPSSLSRSPGDRATLSSAIEEFLGAADVPAPDRQGMLAACHRLLSTEDVEGELQRMLSEELT